MSHSATISGLTPATKYDFRVRSTDGTSKQAISGNFTFTTNVSGFTPVTLGQGWTALPNTLLQSVCPPNNFNNLGYNFSDNCTNVIAAWGGGIGDMARSRLIVWGGGHHDYLGNELYALSLSDQKLTRLNNPGSPLITDPNATDVEALGDGTPNSRHTYGGLAYIAHADRMFVFGGSLAGIGFPGNGTWTLNLDNLNWQRMDPVNGGTPAANVGAVADYDPNTQSVFLHDTASFWQYTFENNTYKNLNPSNSSVISDHNAGVIDPRRRLFFLIGDGFRMIDIGPNSNFALQDISSQTTATCSTLQTAGYPGLAYDPVQDRIIGWAGGSTLFLFNPDTKTCTTTSFTGPGSSQPNGTHGRFRYFPGIRGFVLVNDANQNAFVLKF
jgi:hypothetical protein